jgi:hypothetical protein
MNIRGLVPGFESRISSDNYRTCCTPEAKELPVWLQLDFLEAEELLIFEVELGEAKREALEWRMVGKGVA